MIIEVRDITGKQTATGHCTFPTGTTLGDVFERDERLRKFSKRVVKVQLNGADVTDWYAIQPGKHDKVVVIIEPGEVYALVIIAVISLIISIVRFILSMINQPKSPKIQSVTAAYSFEGLRNTFTPGNVVEVVYGEHEVGGQVLMYYVDVIDDKTEQFNELVAISEGPIDSVQKIFVNGIEASEISGVTTEYRLGTTSQSIIPGFEVIKNTFYDGRDFTHDFNDPNSQSIIYPTVSNDVEAVDLQVAFPAGIGAMRTVGANAGSIRNIGIDYKVRYSKSGENNWIDLATRRRTGGDRQPLIDNLHLTFPNAGAWDLEIWWDNSTRGALRAGTDFFQTALLNVTEYRGPSEAFSSTALVAVRGVGNKKIQGGQPVISSLIRGMRPRIYTSVASYYVGWTQNPAWCVLDYMTNSVYGLGPYITAADIDIQSFIDFAVLADSQTNVCDDSTNACTKSLRDDLAIMGEPRIYPTFFPPADGTRAVLPTPIQDLVRNVSTAYSVSQAGLIICHQCCPHGEWPVMTGVSTPDDFCDRPEITVEYRGSSGAAVGGFAMFVYSGATWDNFTGYAFLYDPGRSKFSVMRYPGYSIVDTGVLLAEADITLSPGNVVNMLVEAPVWSDSMTMLSNHTFWVSVAGSWGGTFVDQILGAADGFPGAGGLTNQWGTNLGAITMPVSQCYPSNEFGAAKYGGYNDILWDEFTNICGKCYCEPSVLDWSCNQPSAPSCPQETIAASLCDFICPYGMYAQLEYDGGTDVAGVIIRVPEDATSLSFTGLEALYVPDQTTIALYLYNNQPINTEGSLLAFLSQTMNSGDILKLQVRSGQTEQYEVLRNSTVLITTSVPNASLDIFNSCITEIYSATPYSPPNGFGPPTIATTYFPPVTFTTPTSYYQSGNAFQVLNDFVFITDTNNNMSDSVDLWLISGSGGFSSYGYKYVEASASYSWSNAGDYWEFAFHHFETTGSPITGICWKMTESGSSTAASISANNFTGYVALNSLVTSELIFGYYKDQSLATLPPTSQIMFARPNSWMQTVSAGALHGMAMNVFYQVPVSAAPNATFREVWVYVGSQAFFKFADIWDQATSAGMLPFLTVLSYGAHINDPSTTNFRFGAHRYDNTNFGLVVVGNSAAGTHATHWRSNSSGTFQEKDYNYTSAVF